jgi:hypothetical protein
MTEALRTAVIAAQSMLGISLSQLWVDAIGLGGTATIFELESYLSGRGELSSFEYDVVAQALNERFVGEQSDHPVPYSSRNQ